VQGYKLRLAQEIFSTCTKSWTGQEVVQILTKSFRQKHLSKNKKLKIMRENFITENDHILSYSYARNNLKSTFDIACDNHTSVTITRKSGGNVVLMSQEDYEGFIETLYLCASKNNYKRITESLNQKGGKKFKNLNELKNAYRAKK
jgi:antitoxin YefM